MIELEILKSGEPPDAEHAQFCGEFDRSDDKRKMIESDVRHWITNHGAEIGGGELVRLAKNFFGRRNTICHIFYGSKGKLATSDEDAGAYKTWLSRDRKSAPHGHGCGNYFDSVDCD